MCNSSIIFEPIHYLKKCNKENLHFQIPFKSFQCFCLYCKDPILFKMLSNLVLRGAKQPWDGEHPDLMEAVEAAVNSAEAAADAAAKPFWCSPCPFEPWIWRN